MRTLAALLFLAACGDTQLDAPPADLQPAPVAPCLWEVPALTLSYGGTDYPIVHCHGGQAGTVLEVSTVTTTIFYSTDQRLSFTTPCDQQVRAAFVPPAPSMQFGLDVWIYEKGGRSTCHAMLNQQAQCGSQTLTLPVACDTFEAAHS